jgi:hypothetical protein
LIVVLLCPIGHGGLGGLVETIEADGRPGRGTWGDLLSTAPPLRVFIYSPYGITPLAQEIATALNDLAVEVGGPTDAMPDSDVDALVVMLSADGSGGARDKALESSLERWSSVLVPVVPDSTSSPTLPELSQLLIGRIGVAAAARRITTIARFGGSTLADLFRLEADAATWVGEGRPNALLPRGSTVDVSLHTITTAIGLASADATAFVRAGLARRRRRTRRFSVTAALAACLLAITSTVAIVQRAGATQATRESEQLTAEADSVRLARLAVQTQGIDPDLPWLLANQALHTARTPEAVDAARRVLATTPEHVSVPLPGLPDYLSADPTSDTVAINYVDGPTDIRSASDGRLLRSFTQPARLSTLAPGGETVLLDGEFVDVASGKTVRKLETGQQFRGWAGATAALVRVGGQLAVLDLGSGGLRQFAIPLSSGTYAWSLAAHAPIANLMDGNSLLSVDLTSGTALPPVSIDDARDVATSDDGTRVFVARQKGPSQAFSRTGTALTPIGGAGSGTSVITAGSSWVLAGAEGQVEWTSSGENSVAYRYIAHRGPTVGVGLAADGRTVTAGGDHYLRVWSPPQEQVTYTEPGLQAVMFDPFNRAIASTRFSARSLLALSPDSGRLTYVVQSDGLAGVVDARRLDRVSGPMELGLITVTVVPLANGQAAFFKDGGQTGVVDIAAGSIVWQRKVDRLAVTSVIVAASADRARLAFASFAGLVSYGSTGDVTTNSFDGQETPVAVLFDSADAASVVTSEGHWYRESGAAVQLSVADSAIAAAGLAPDGSLVIVQQNGTLSRYTNGKLVKVTSVNADMQAFALRFSPDGSLIGVLGAVRGVVLNSSSGRLVADLYPTGLDSSIVRDVALTGDAVWEVRSDGGLVRRPIVDDDTAVARIADHLPRAIRPAESAALAGAVDTIGQH